jgi:hypothetical protein
MHRGFSLFLFVLFWTTGALAAFSECYTFLDCEDGRSKSTTANPVNSNKIQINPSAVPTEKGFGIEAVFYDGETDFALVQGLGRIGAAISPANSEETFFGAPGIELESEYLERKQSNKKYPGQKITVATAFDLIKRKNSGLKSYGLKLGVIGKYNRLTKAVNGGGGLSGILGPFVAGAAFYNDETEVDHRPEGSDTKTLERFQVITYNGGISMNSLLVDYSVLRMADKETLEVSTVRLVTASLLYKKLILTASKRIENSARKAYNYETRELEVKSDKEDYFGGLQINVTKNLMIGALYNYYLVHEYSATGTLFF